MKDSTRLLILPRVELPVGGHVGEKYAHSPMLGPNVPVHVRDLFGVHVAVRTLEPRSLAASVPHVPPKVRLPSESARAIRTVEPLRLVPPHAEATAN